MQAISKSIAALGLGSLLAISAAAADNASTAIRHLNPNSNFPIAAAVEIPANANLVYLSGAVPPTADAAQPANSLQAYGSTETQTIGTLKSIQASLERLGLKMGDVVKMQVYLVGDPNQSGKMDFDGFMRGYTQFFGTSAQPNLPSRSVFQVAGLANPGWLVEIEVVAVRPPKTQP